jgi:flagella basal body P-ring formation protein FlgA
MIIPMKSLLNRCWKPICALLLVALPGGASASGFPATDVAVWTMKTNAVVISSGLALSDVVIPPTGLTLPHYRISDAPKFGSTLTITREFVDGALAKVLSINVGTNWAGASQLLVTRRARHFDEAEMLTLLTERITQDHLSTGGTLELRTARSWSDIVIPDESFEMKIVSMPPQGVMGSFRVRFELGNETEEFGTWEVSVRASLWKDVWIARQRLNRGDVLVAENLVREKRDVLASRDHLEADDVEILPNSLELTENLREGSPLKPWSVRPKPMVYRGQMADALVNNGALSIILKVQVLEDGILGQNIRIRNPHTKRELIGKVNNDQTIQINL